MYTPFEATQYAPLFVNPVNSGPLAGALRSNGGAAPVSLAYPTTNRIHYHPIIIPSACTWYRSYWLNGATVGTNNFQVGIYNDNDAGTDGPGTAFFRSTSTLSAGANACQFVDDTDTPIPAGRYWLAIWGSGTTDTLFRVAGITSNQFNRNLLSYIETNAGGLPTTATPTQNTATPFWPIYGFTTISAP